MKNLSNILLTGIGTVPPKLGKELKSIWAVLAVSLSLVGVSAQNAMAVGTGTDAQLIAVDGKGGISEFVQANALDWVLTKSGSIQDYYKETLRSETIIELKSTKRPEAIQFDFEAGLVRRQNPSLKSWEDIGRIRKAIPTNGETVKGYSFLLTGEEERLHTDLDQLFTNGGNASGWRRVVYSAPGLRQGEPIPQTNGRNVQRVMTETSAFMRLPDLEGLPAGFPQVARWGEFPTEPLSVMEHMATVGTSDPLEKPKFTFVETGRDEWSVYLQDINRKSVQIQIDLYKKQIMYGENNGPKRRLANTMPEPFLGFSQFSLANYAVKTDVQLSVKRNSGGPTTITADGVAVDFARDQCSPKAGFNRCELLQGEYAARSVTGRSIGSFGISYTYRPNGLYRSDIYTANQQGSFTRSRDNFGVVSMYQSRNRVYLSRKGLFGEIDIDTRRFIPSAAVGDFVGDDVKIDYLREFYPNQFKGDIPIPKPGIGPGFQVTNKTEWPVLVSIDQVGCLYHEIIQPGKTYEVSTGSVWFTVKAMISPVLEEPTDWDCAAPALVFAGSVLLTGGLTYATGGAVLVPMAMAFAAIGQGAAAGTTAALEADGMSGNDARLVGSGVAIGVAILGGGVTSIVTQSVKNGTVEVGRVVAGKVIGDAVLRGMANTMAQAGRNFVLREPRPGDLDTITAQLQQEASKAGVYAGHTWPWSDADRKKAIFEVTGGPMKKYYPDGIVEFLLQEKPLTLKQLN